MLNASGLQKSLQDTDCGSELSYIMQDTQKRDALLLSQLQQNIALQANYIERIDNISPASRAVLKFLQKQWQKIHLTRSMHLLKQGQYLLSFLVTDNDLDNLDSNTKAELNRFLRLTRIVRTFETQLQTKLQNVNQAYCLGQINENTYLKNLYFCYTGQNLTTNENGRATVSEILARLSPRGE